MTKPIDSAEAETLLVEYVEVYNKMYSILVQGRDRSLITKKLKWVSRISPVRKEPRIGTTIRSSGNNRSRRFPHARSVSLRAR
jgi:hypothetical protein